MNSTQNIVSKRVIPWTFVGLLALSGLVSVIFIAMRYQLSYESSADTNKSLEDKWNDYSLMENICFPTLRYINYNRSSSHLVPVKRCACNACVVAGQKCLPTGTKIMKQVVEIEYSRGNYSYEEWDFEEHTNCTCKLATPDKKK